MELKIEINCHCGEENLISLEGEKNYTCKSCGNYLFKLHIISGFVYVLSNPSMPGLIKIGYTERNVNERVNELNNTGIPTAFEIEAVFDSPDPYGDEQKIHSELAEYRVSKNREFFSMELKEAINSINAITGREISYIKKPDLLLQGVDRQIFIIEQEIGEIDELREMLTKSINKKDWREILGFVNSKSSRRKFNSSSEKENYEHELISKIITDKLVEDPIKRDDFKAIFSHQKKLKEQLEQLKLKKPLIK